jgi:hypothetical protein
LVAKTRRRLISITLCNPDFFIFKRDTNSKPMLPVAEGKADHLHRILVCAEIALDAPKEGIQLFFPQCLRTGVPELRSIQQDTAIVLRILSLDYVQPMAHGRLG